MTPLDTRLPPSIQDFWRSLHSEVVWLHGRWILYKQLFGTSPERIDILNAAAPTFFNIQQTIMLNDVQLSISKFGDPARTGTRTNLTLSVHIESFKVSCDKIRHRRNKWIAHFDLNSMLQKQVVPLPGPSREEIERALEQLRAAMNSIATYYGLSQTLYEHFSMAADGEFLVSTLRKGIRYQQLVKEGVIGRDDMRKNFALKTTKTEEA